MKKALVIVALLSAVAVANAEITLFWTLGTAGYGLTNQGQINPVSGETYEFTPSSADVSDDDVPNYNNNLDNNFGDGPYVLGNAPAVADAYQNDINTPLVAGNGVFAYLWMNYENEANNAKLISAMFDYSLGGSTAWMPEQVTYYKQDDLGGEGAKRWDGNSTMPSYSEFEQDPQSLTAVTAFGIRNRPTGSDEWNLFDNGTRTALLGAIDLSTIDMTGTDPLMLSIDIPADGNGDPLFVISNVPVSPTVKGFYVIPEPASMLLLGLAGLLIRRR